MSKDQPETSAWSATRLDGDPRLILGWRRYGTRIAAARVDLHEDTFDTLTELCKKSLISLDAASSRTYEPYAQIEFGEEYFAIQVDELPTKKRPRRQRSDSTTESANASASDMEVVEVSSKVAVIKADLLHILENVDNLEAMDAGNISTHNFNFYAICWKSDAGTTSFVRKSNPRKMLSHGNRYFQYGDTLKRVSQPDLVLDDWIDIVIHNDIVAVRAPEAFKVLMADVGVVLQDVPEYVDSVSSALLETVPLSPASQDALRRVAGRRTSLASRLHVLQERIHALDLDAKNIRAAAERHVDDVSLILDENDNFVFDDSSVPVFLDLVEGRLFEDDFTGERRRADRFSRRK